MMGGASSSKPEVDQQDLDDQPKSKSKSKEKEKESNGSLHKKQKQLSKESQKQQKAQKTRKQDQPAASTSGQSSCDNATASPSLGRPPLRASQPILVPKIEKRDDRQPILPLAWDPRHLNKGPIIDHPEATEEEPARNTPPKPTKLIEEAHIAPIIKTEYLSSQIEITNHNVKQETVDPNWKEPYLKGEPIVPPVRIKTEPVDEDDANTAQAIEDDNCSVESGSTVGLPSPPRSPSPSHDTNLEEEKQMLINSEPDVPTAIRREKEKVAQEKKYVYSQPTDLAELYRQLEEEKSSRKVAKTKPGYSQDYSDESFEDTDEEMPMMTNDEESGLTAREDRRYYSDNDGLSDDDECPSWVTPVPPEDDERTVEKRRLSDNESKDSNAKKKRKQSNFICQKISLGAITSSAADEAFPSITASNSATDEANSSILVNSSATDEAISSIADSSFATNEATPSISASTVTDEPIPSTSAASSSETRASDVETTTSQQSSELVPNSSAPPVSNEVNADNSERTPVRPKVKKTETNRNARMVEDYLKSVASGGTKVPKKREPKILKTPPKRKRHPTGDNSAPSSPSNLSIPDFEDSGPLVLQPSQAKQPNPGTSVTSVRDPRLRSKMGRETSLTVSLLPAKKSDVILSKSLEIKREIITRMFKWKFGWIEEQSNLSGPPPLLQKIVIGKERELEEMPCGQVLGKYLNLESYFNTFRPLLMHEMWSTLCLQYEQDKSEKKHLEWDIMVTSSTKDDHFLLLDCCLVMEVEAEAPKVDDLIVITFTRPSTGKLIHPFAIVEKSTTTKVVRIADLNQGLLGNRKPNFMAEITVRILSVYAHTQTNVIYSASKIANLSTSLNLFHVQAAFISSPLLGIILDPRPPAFQMFGCTPMSMENLDASQARVVFSIGQTMLITPRNEPKVAVLQGYPGTGKTHVIVHIISHLVGHKQGDFRHRVLFCAPTNAAVDEMVRRLISYNRKTHPSDRFNVLRMGSWARLHPDVKEVTLEDHVNRVRGRVKHENSAQREVQALEEKLKGLHVTKQTLSNQLDSLEETELLGKIAQVEDEIDTVNALMESTKKSQKEKIAEDLKDFEHQLISNADVICTTLEGCHSPQMESIFIDEKPDRKGNVARPFLCCIIDDASLCTEPQTLIPLALGMNKLILVGDIELLPLNLNSSLAKSKKLDQSLFTRFEAYLKVTNIELLTLSTQHRMDSQICHWPSKYYYGNALVTSERLRVYSPLHSYRVFDVRNSHEMCESTSYTNRPEAEVIVRLIEHILRSPHMRDRSIGVITFYEKQRILIRHLIREKFPNDYNRTDVKLVQDFQGTEMDIVIISCVKTSISRYDKELKMVIDHWNVAITRATESLFICGHLKFLQHNEVLNDLILDAAKRQVIHRVSSELHSSLLYDLILKPIPFGLLCQI